MKGIESRSRWEIILDILKVTSEREGRARKTRIMQNAYLDWRNFQRHFGFLQEQGFVGNHDDPKGGTSYYLTEKGMSLMQRLKEVEKLLG
jgi:predicted transcriptional regulator